MKHTIFQQSKGNQQVHVFLDEEDGLVYLNFEAKNNGVPCGFSLTLNSLQREIDEYEAERIQGEQKPDKEEIFNNFMKSLDAVLKIV